MHLTHVRCALHQAHAGPHLFVSGRVPVTPILGECLAKPEVLPSAVRRRSQKVFRVATKGKRKEQAT